MNRDPYDTRIEPNEFRSFGSWELVEVVAKNCRQLQAAANRLSKFAKLAKGITNSCVASDSTNRNIASDLSEILGMVDRAYDNLSDATRREMFLSDKATSDEIARNHMLSATGETRLDSGGFTDEEEDEGPRFKDICID